MRFHSLLGLAVLAALQIPLAAQADWRSVPTAMGPGCTTAFGITYELRRRRILSFGGYLQSANCKQAPGRWDETLTYDGRTWAKLSPKTVPPGRFAHRLAHDWFRGRTLMYGGCSGFYRQETWEFDGNDWQQLKPTNSPPALCAYGMVFDVARRKTLLFGGDNTRGTHNQTWQWDGQDWTQLTPVRSPSPRRWPAMCYDIKRGRTLLFGGNRNLNDTWTWDGTNWTQLFPKTSPSPRSRMDIVYDTARDRVVLFSGASLTGLIQDTWEFDGAEWMQRSPKNSPPAMWEAGSVYDLGRNVTVTFGGDKTWEYSSKTLATYSIFGRGCSGSNGVPRLDESNLPWIGDTLMLSLSSTPASSAALITFGSSRTQWGSVRLPLDLSSIGMPGCSILTSIDAAFPISNTTTGALHLPLLTLPSLIGLRFYNQGLVLDATANARGITTTNGGEGRIGAR